jgi:hypothetical protein
LGRAARSEAGSSAPKEVAFAKLLAGFKNNPTKYKREKMGSLVRKIYGGLRIVQVCSDWPEWFHKYFTSVNDGSAACYRMRCGTRLHTRRNRGDFHMIDEIWAYRK